MNSRTISYSTGNRILASKGPYKHSIKQMVESSPLRFYGLEQERLDLSQLKKDLDYWLGSLQDLLEGDYYIWNSASRLLLLQDSEQKLHEFKFRYGHTGRRRSLPRERHNVQMSIEKMRMRAAKLVKELRDIWIISSIKYTERVARSTSNMGQRRLRCNGVVEL